MRLPRSCTLAVAFVAVAVVCAFGGCHGNGGAVSVRWRIANLSTGETFDPMSARAADGSCCSDVQLSVCCPQSIWVVRAVSVTLRDPTTGEPDPNVAPRTAPCMQRESTTAFDLPAGTFAIGLTAEVLDCGGSVEPSTVPPPEIHTIVRGEVVNLQDIQIGVQPLPHALPLPPPGSLVTF